MPRVAIARSKGCNTAEVEAASNEVLGHLRNPMRWVLQPYTCAMETNRVEIDDI